RTSGVSPAARTALAAASPDWPAPTMIMGEEEVMAFNISTHRDMSMRRTEPVRSSDDLVRAVGARGAGAEPGDPGLPRRPGQPHPPGDPRALRPRCRALRR